MKPLQILPVRAHYRLSRSRTARKLALYMGLAIIIVFLVIAVLFESFFYPLIIMLSVPVAAAGGIAGLAVLHLFTYQALDC